MSDKTKIEWADATVNAINGCTVKSPGCTNCYAMAAGGRNLPGHPSTGLTMATKAGHVWTGEVRLKEKALLMPLKWKKPRRIFWNAHGDLFHPKVPDEWIYLNLASMAMTYNSARVDQDGVGQDYRQKHIHMVLTKRSRRMREFMQRLFDDLKDFSNFDHPFYIACQRISKAAGHRAWMNAVFNGLGWFNSGFEGLWLGTSVEDQARKYRIDDLRNTPAAVRFISAEPLLESLGEVDFTGIDWAIVGGESGPKARPIHPDWARSLRDQCAAAGVAFHFKQWGEWVPEALAFKDCWKGPVVVDFDGRYRAAEDALPSPNSALMIRVGKKRAGRLLDGVEHSEFPA